MRENESLGRKEERLERKSAKGSAMSGGEVGEGICRILPQLSYIWRGSPSHPLKNKR